MGIVGRSRSAGARRSRTGGSALLAVAAVCLTLAGSARAEEPKVEVDVKVVTVSNQGNAVDPALASMKDKFTKEHFNFSSYKLESSQRLTVQQKKPAELKLPTGKRVTFKLESLQKGTATIAVAVEKGVSTVYQLGREGSLYINAGHHGDGEVFLVLSPTGGS